MFSIKSIRILLFLTAFVPILARAQDKPSFARIDSLTYQAWRASDWKKVLEYTRVGLNNGYDYYYLRMRSGLAELGLNNGVRAAMDFSKALEFNANDPAALQDLYASYLLSGQASEARVLASDKSPAFRKKLGVPSRRLITSAFMEAGYMVNSNADSIKNYRPEAGTAILYHIPFYWYFSAGLHLETGKRFSATLATNILSFKAFQQYLYTNQTPLSFDVPYDQRAVYLSGTYYAGQGVNLTLAGQLMSYTLPLYHWVAGETGGQYLSETWSYRDLAFNATIVKQFPYVNLGLFADVNRFRNFWYYQAGADVTVYPAGNVNTFLRGGAAWLSDSSRIIARAGIGRKISRTFWIEGEYYFGNIRNFSEGNAFVVFNNFDMITRRLGISLLAYKVLPHLDFSLRYQYTLRSASWQTYSNSQYLGDIFKGYPVHSIIGGLIWRF